MNKIQAYSKKDRTGVALGKDILDFQVSQLDNWEKTKIKISQNTKHIIWKAWIEPLNFIEYKEKILHLYSNSQFIMIFRLLKVYL